MFTGIKNVSFKYAVLNGCRHHCSGCTQKKESNPQITDADFIALKTLYDDLLKHGVFIQEMALTPTDFMSASNRTELMDESRLIDLAAYGVDFDVNLTCLDQNKFMIADLTNDYNKLPRHIRLELGVPYEYAKRFNKKYQQHIVNTLNLLQDKLNNPITDIQFLVNYSEPTFYSENKEPLTSEGFNELVARNIYPGAKIDLALPDTNLNLKDLNVRAALRKSIDNLNRVYVDIMKDNLRDQHATTIYSRALPDVENCLAMNYYDGELYISAVAFDIVFIKDDLFKIDKPWSYESINNSLMRMTDRGFEYAEKTKDCLCCPHLPNCAIKGTLGLMELARYKDCVSMLRDNNDLIKEHQSLVFSTGAFTFRDEE